MKGLRFRLLPLQAPSSGRPPRHWLSEGDVLVVYYAGPETHATGIEWACLRP